MKYIIKLITKFLANRGLAVIPQADLDSLQAELVNAQVKIGGKDAAYNNQAIQLAKTQMDLMRSAGEINRLTAIVNGTLSPSVDPNLTPAPAVVPTA